MRSTMHDEDAIIAIRREQGRSNVRAAVAKVAIDHGGEERRAAIAAIKAAAYLAGSQYDEQERRKLACAAIWRSFMDRIEANEAVHPFERDTMFTSMMLNDILPQGSVFESMCDNAASAAKGAKISPLDAGIAAAEISASLLVAWVRRNDKPDAELRLMAEEARAVFGEEFEAASERGRETRKALRERDANFLPRHGWRGTSEASEASPERLHMAIPGFLDAVASENETRYQAY